MTEGYLAILMALARRFSYNLSAWNWLKKTQLQILKRAEKCSNDESDANYDGDEDFDVEGEGQPT